MNRICKECGDRLVGREDKKFCCDACRNTFNNRINRDVSNHMRNVNNNLRRNYRILSELNPTGKARTTRAKLAAMGFDFNCCTGIQTTRGGKTYFRLYNQGYLTLENGAFLLVKKDAFP